jgi:hypothetical protein
MINNGNLTAPIDSSQEAFNRPTLKRINQSSTHRDKAIASSRKSPKSSFLKFSDTMPCRFKVGDRVEGKHAAIRNSSGRILEIIPMAAANRLKVRWNHGLVESYSSRALQFPVVALPLGFMNNLPQNALAVAIPGNHLRGAQRQYQIANNGEKGDSSEESNYGSR